MAHVQAKSEPEHKVPDSKVTKSAPNPSNTADEGGSWQFKFVMGVIVLGVLMLILKSAGLF